MGLYEAYSNKELEEELLNLRKWFNKKIRNKESARKFLVELGVNNSDGTLTENYK